MKRYTIGLITGMIITLSSITMLFTQGPHTGKGEVISVRFSELKAEGKFRIGETAYRNLQKHYHSGTANETETYQAMKKVGAQYDILVCPHTAVGLHVAEDYLGDLPMISLATAHPAKFPVAVEKATDIKPELPERVSNLFLKSERVTKLPNRLEVIKETIKERIAT